MENFGIESKFKRGFEKSDIHVVITIELTTIMSLILTFQPKLIPMFFHMNFIREFRSSIQNWRSTTSVVIIIGVRGIKDSKGEQQLFIANGEGESDQDVLVLANNFRTKYEQLFVV
jgi:hypothetical protein